MDPTALLLLGGFAIIVVAAVLFALNRSWGDFPGRAGVLPAEPAAPSAVERPAPLLDRALALPPEPAAPIVPDSPVLITHPLVRQAAENALRQGGAPAHYIVSDGDQLYFVFGRISDPAQRQAAYDMMRRFQAGEDVDLHAMLALVRQLFQTL
jgi:hypothetical protein